MKIAVTGAKGFLGGRIVEAALKEGHTVTGIDLRRGDPPLLEGNYTELNCDIVNPGPDAEECLKGSDALIHAAALIKGRPEDLLRTNLKGTEKLLDLAAGAEPIRFVFISSLAAFENHPSAYGRSKREGEARVIQRAADFSILRPAMIYGRDDPLWTADIRKKVTRRAPLLLPGRGRAKIQPLYVEDAAKAALAAAVNARASGGTFDLGGPEPMEQIAFYRLARRILKGKALILPVPLWPLKLLGIFLKGRFASPLRSELILISLLIPRV